MPVWDSQPSSDWGDDTVIGIDFVDVLSRFMEDDNTRAIVMIGQLGGTFEEQGAEWYRSCARKNR